MLQYLWVQNTYQPTQVELGAPGSLVGKRIEDASSIV